MEMGNDTMGRFNGLTHAGLALVQDQGSLGHHENTDENDHPQYRTGHQHAQTPGNTETMKSQHGEFPFTCPSAVFTPA